MNTVKQTNWQALFGGEKKIHYSLDRILAALQALGNPHLATPSLVIAGTNGKGTTTLLLTSVLQKAGYDVATYLSPHLQSPSERFLWNLCPISEFELNALLENLYPVAQKHELSYFEFLTLAFFEWQKTQNAQFQILEVGLGGRLDATNVTDPLACLITQIGLDHSEWLGNTEMEILREKLGILRKESLCFSGVDRKDLQDEIEKTCNELDGVYYFSSDVHCQLESIDWTSQTIRIHGQPFYLRNASEGIRKNAVLAYLTARIIFPRISIDVIQKAFAQIQTPGRFEVVSHSPRVILSGDHNLAGIDSLFRTLDTLPRTKLRIVCGFSGDKPAAAMYERLKTISEDITLTQPGTPRVPTLEGYDKLGPYIASPEAAVRSVLQRMDPQDTLLITGSLYLIGAVRSLWNTQAQPLASPLTNWKPLFA